MVRSSIVRFGRALVGALAAACGSYGAAADVPPDAGAQSEAGADGGPDTAAADLVAWYAFDETSGKSAKDGSSNHLDADLVGNAAFTASGKRGGAVALLADGDYVLAPRTALLDLTDELTIALWEDLRAQPTKNSRFASYGDSWDFGISSVSSRNPEFSAATFVFEANWNTPVEALPKTEWHHLAVTFARGVVTGYVDGAEAPVLKSTFASGFVLGGTNGARLVIGAQPDGTSATVGAIDDVRIYRRALRSDEIAPLAR